LVPCIKCHLHDFSIFGSVATGTPQKHWILGQPVEDKGLLKAPDLGPVADTITMYEAVKRIKPVPLGKQSLLAIIIPALLPMIPVLAIKVPVKDTLLRLLGILI
jgi:hypothetical protein